MNCVSELKLPEVQLDFINEDLKKIKINFNYRCRLRYRYIELMEAGYNSEYLQKLITECDWVDNAIFEKIKNSDDIREINKLYLRIENDLSVELSADQMDFLEMLAEIIGSMREVKLIQKTKLSPELDILDDKINIILNYFHELDELPKQVRKSPLTEQGGILGKIKTYVKKDDEFKPLTSFTVQPVEAIQVPDQGEFIRTTLIADKQRREIIIPPDAWLSNQKFLKALPSKEFVFFGSSVDVQLLRSHISSYDMPHKKGLTVAGFHGDDFITEAGAVKDHDLVYLNDQKTYCELIHVTPLNKRPDNLHTLKSFNIPEVALPILGWTVACFFKPRILKILGGFPVLNIFGEPGSGKTTTLRGIIMRLWALKSEPRSISQQTEFTLMKFVSLANSIPLLLEENKRALQDDKSRVIISNLIRSAYNSLEGQRGRADQSLQHYKYEAPCAIVGEQGFAEPALLDRMVIVQMSKQDSIPNKPGFDNVQKLPLESIGRSILDRTLKMPGKKVREILKQELTAVSKDLNDRPRDNAAVCRFGLRILGEVTGLDFTAEQIDKAVLTGISEDDRVERKSSVDKIIEAMGAMSAFNPSMQITKDREAIEVRSYSFTEHLKPLVHYQVYYINEIKQLRLWIPGAYPVFLKWARNYSFDGDLLDELSFKKQLKKENYYIKSMLSDIGQKRRRVLVLNIDIMEKKKIEIPDEWMDDKVTSC